ncbi:S-layer homology domain-containing protein [Candidatus Dojkabacteria bacterium]|nr:S-layer homology domain-containing protein [Candidatus Dojkabacteria bacterium]
MKNILKNDIAFKIVFASIFGVIVLFSNGTKVAAFTGSGSGVFDDPFLITSCSELQSIKMDSDTYDKLYVLANDIDCSDTINWNQCSDDNYTDQSSCEASWNGVQGGYNIWKTEGKYGFQPLNEFYGTLDGQGHTISDLYINREGWNYIGLFGLKYSSNFIGNFVLDNVDISGQYYVGAVAGFTGSSNALLYNIGVTGQIKGSEYIGGLIGGASEDFTIRDCNVDADVVAYSDTVGGIIGIALNNNFSSTDHASIARVYAEGSVSGLLGNREGGFIGHINNAIVNISDSFSVMDFITSTNQGGIAGVVSNSTLTVSNTYFDDTKTNENGCVYSESASTVTTTSCLAINESDQPNGLIDTSTDKPLNLWDFVVVWDTVEDYPILKATSNFDPPGAVTNFDVGIFDRNNIAVNWDVPSDTGGLPIKPYNGYEIQIKKSGDEYSWDEPIISDAPNDADEEYQEIDLEFDTSYVVRVRAVTNYSVGPWESDTVTTDSAQTHDISTCTELQNIPTIGHWRDNYRLTADIDCSETTTMNFTEPYCSDDSYDNQVDCEANEAHWFTEYYAGFTPLMWSYQPDGYEWSWDMYFHGNFDGQDHTITNLMILRPNSDSVGLFEELGSGANIHNFSISGDVTGFYSVGAIAGYAMENISIQNVISLVNVFGRSYMINSGWGDYYTGGGMVGGLLGEYDSEDEDVDILLNILNNNVSGEVTGSFQLGGLIGFVDIYNNGASVINISGNTVSGNINSSIQTEGEFIGEYISGNDVGGLIGEYDFDAEDEYVSNDVTISDNLIQSSTLISGYEDVGGLVGGFEIYNDDYDDVTVNVDFGPNNAVFATIDSTDQSGAEEIGGLIGYLEYDNDYDNNVGNLRIFQSFVNSDITTNANNVGGLVGYVDLDGDDNEDFELTIEDSYFKGNISGDTYLGGLVGYMYEDDWYHDTLIINRVYAAGNITGYEAVGGLVGYNEAMTTIDDAFAANEVSADNYYGSFFGDGYPDDVIVTNSYYDYSKNNGMGCWDDDDLEGCIAVNEDGESSEYFFNNNSVDVFNSDTPWDFDDVWQTNLSDYPTLRFYVPEATTEVWVDDDYTVDGQNDDHEWGVDAFDNIASAVEAVNEDGTVNVGAGNYENFSNLIITKALSLIGPGKDNEFPATIASNCSIVFVVDSYDVTIQGLKIRETVDGLIDGDICNSRPLIRVNPDVTGVTINGNNLMGGQPAIGLRANNEDSTVTNNTISYATLAGISLGGANLSNISGNEISNITFGQDGGGNGITVGCGFSCTYGDTVISDNNIHNNIGNGIFYSAGDQEGDLTIGANNIIHENADGVYVSGSAYNVHINGNQIYDNTNPDSALHVENALTGLDVTANWWGHESGPYIDSNPGSQGDTISVDENSSYVFYRPFCIVEDCSELSTKEVSGNDITNLFDEYDGTFTIPEAEQADPENITEIDVNEETIITIPVTESENTVITLPADTVITKSGGGTFSALDLSAADMALDALSGFQNGELVGAFQWGIPAIGLAFSPAIRVDMFVGIELAGETLTLQRSLSTDGGWTQLGLLGLNGAEDGTCLVSAEGICSFETTLASYYGATVTTTTTGTGGSGSQGLTYTETSITTLNDITGSSFETYINNLVEAGVIDGYSDGTYRPDENVTREQMAKFIVKAFGFTLSTDNNPGFPDIATDSKYIKEINTLKALGIVSGYSDGSYKPSQIVTRAEVTKFIVLSLEKKEKIVPSNITNRFPDIATDNLFLQYINYLAQSKVGDSTILGGFSDGTYGPELPLTRGQMAKIIWNSMEFVKS